MCQLFPENVSAIATYRLHFQIKLSTPVCLIYTLLKTQGQTKPNSPVLSVHLGSDIEHRITLETEWILQNTVIKESLFSLLPPSTYLWGLLDLCNFISKRMCSQVMEWLSSDQRVSGTIPIPCRLHVKVLLLLCKWNLAWLELTTEIFCISSSKQNGKWQARAWRQQTFFLFFTVQ